MKSRQPRPPRTWPRPPVCRALSSVRARSDNASPPSLDFRAAHPDRLRMIPGKFIWKPVSQKALPRQSAADWLEIVNQFQSEAELSAVRHWVNRGCPYGDADWIARTARSLGLELALRPRGRPRTRQ